MATDNLLDGVLTDYPRLRGKLLNFCADYGLLEKPAVIWQCHPTTALEVNVSDKAVREAIEAGAPETESNGWWHGFRSGRRSSPIFDGVAACSAADEQGWMSEFHTDVHVIGGLWRFPDSQVRDGSSSLLLSNFHRNAFHDFASLANRLSSLFDQSNPCLVTCTLINSDQIRFSRERHPYASTKVTRRFLQWRVRAAKDASERTAAYDLMAVELVRAFGNWPL